MKRSWTILIVVALAFTTAPAAGAGIDCELRPDHPKAANSPIEARPSTRSKSNRNQTGMAYTGT